MFQNLDLTLHNLLKDLNVEPTLAGVEVSFKRPDKVVSFDDPTIDLFLYAVRENRLLRDPVPLIEWDAAAGEYVRKRPPLRVDCDYLVTAWSKKPLDAGVEEEHRLLAQALAKLSIYPVIPDGFLQGDLFDSPFPVPLWVAQEEDGKNLGEFWSSLGISPRASFHLMATIAISFKQTELAGPPVTTRTLLFDDDVDETTPAADPIYSFGGTVRDGVTTVPVFEATVTLDGKRSVETNEQGRYVFTGVAAGTYTVEASKGAKNADITVDIPPDPQAQPPPTLTDFDITL